MLGEIAAVSRRQPPARSGQRVPTAPASGCGEWHGHAAGNGDFTAADKEPLYLLLDRILEASEGTLRLAVTERGVLVCGRFALLLRRLTSTYAVGEMDGNATEQKTPEPFLERIELMYGKAKWVWMMNRGIPPEATLRMMREPERGTCYLVRPRKGARTSTKRAG